MNSCCARASLALWLVAAALLMRAFMPAGIMPVSGADGWTVVICSADGPLTMTLDENGVPQRDTAASALCDFACTLGQAALLALALLGLIRVLAPARRAVPWASSWPDRLRAGLPPPSRAPPRIS